MHDQTLQAIDKSLVKAAKCVVDVANDPKKCECVCACAVSQTIVKWIRMQTTVNYGKLVFYGTCRVQFAQTIHICQRSLFIDVNDLQKSVNMSLATAAGVENAYTRDRAVLL